MLRHIISLIYKLLAIFIPTINMLLSKSTLDSRLALAGGSACRYIMRAFCVNESRPSSPGEAVFTNQSPVP